MLFFVTFRVLVYFFFPSQLKFKIHSFTQIQKAGKNIQHCKKKHHFHSVTRFITKNGKLNFSGEIKKYGTFDYSLKKKKANPLVKDFKHVENKTGTLQAQTKGVPCPGDN